MDQQRKRQAQHDDLYRWSAHFSAATEYRPFGFEVPATEDGLRLFGPAQLSVIGVPVAEGIPEVELSLTLIDGRYRITKLTASQENGVDIEALRRVSFRSAIKAHVRNLIDVRVLKDGAWTVFPVANVSDEFLRAVILYQVVYAVGGDPIRELAEELAITRSAAAQRVRRARDKGLLPPTTQGAR